ncbi:MAG: peptidoglycan DD-metalloendopeptidase family protein [Proteobacteria bacterium]|nr:peptidoglycan DD-metalloendopeptidase family protein [Pseudomonadota bacterium]MBI3499517.1 peptidoglycan DD-metalloendopeptidase family protein [Pseudomonadota bacterium]
MHRLRFPSLATLLLTAAAVAGASFANESEPQRRLGEVERALQAERDRQAQADRRAEALAREVAVVRAELIQTARHTQENEAALSALESALAGLEAEAKEKEAGLGRRRLQLAELTAALVRLSRLPPETLIVLPLSPLDAVHSGILLGSALPPVKEAAEALAAETQALARVRTDIVGQRRRIQATTVALAAERDRLDELLKRRSLQQRRAESQAEQVAKRAAELAASARDLRELMERLEADRQAREAELKRLALAVKPAPKPEPPPSSTPAVAVPSIAAPPSGQQASLPPGMATPVVVPLPPPGELARPFTHAHGSLAVPAAGHVVVSYGEVDDAGLGAKGITVQTRPEAPVVAPFDGRVVFAGPFRGYGQILIIDHGEGYHSLLSGLGRIDSGVGQWLLGGEPVGVMGPADQGNPKLYVELRRNGQPINPLPWWAANNGRVSG